MVKEVILEMTSQVVTDPRQVADRAESDKSEDEDPGETRSPPKKRQGDPIEELVSRPEDVTQEGVQREALKREAAGSLDVESPKKGPRIDEGTTEVVEPKEKSLG